MEENIVVTRYNALKLRYSALGPGALDRNAQMVAMARRLRKMEAKHEILRNGEKSGPFQTVYFATLKRNPGA